MNKLPLLANLFDAATPLVVMVSGGGDSVALLRLLAEGAFGERTPALDHVRVLHVNHGLRAQQAASDEAFTAELCEQLGYRCELRHLDVATQAVEEKRNVEDLGRDLRYEAADELCDELCAELGVSASEGRIATAHTLDDRVETFFERALFGAGTGALASIRPVRGRIVRPLLRCQRSDLRDYLDACAQDWCEDATNADTTRTRAFIRAKIVPTAEELAPAFRPNLERTMDLLAEDDNLLDELATGFVRDFSDVQDGDDGQCLMLDVDMLATLDPVMTRRVLRRALLDAFPEEASRLPQVRYLELADALTTPGYQADLGKGLRAQRSDHTLIIKKLPIWRREETPDQARGDA
ncbi:MAG: tRNA lysidine(34) synthetase TilS [Coriobacteriia bacterium]|nr:tRNA lysidine(34) synthetase TilS [Coriobacteriia bacterium]